MSETQGHAPGTFCWPELATTNAEAVKPFYTGLFGWSVLDHPMPEGTYTMFQLGGRDVGAMYSMTPDMVAQGIPPHWLLYVAVASADESVERAKSLGGQLVMGPFDVYDLGRMAVLRDPTNAVFAVWQAKRHEGASVLNQVGALRWSELATNDVAAAESFYTGLFDWRTDSMPMGPITYTLFHRGDMPAGGMLQMTEEWGNIPPHWMPYFQVDDCEASVEKAQSLGGEVKVAPTHAPTVGKFALLQDPRGAHFSIIEMNPPA